MNLLWAFGKVESSRCQDNSFSLSPKRSISARIKSIIHGGAEGGWRKVFFHRRRFTTELKTLKVQPESNSTCSLGFTDFFFVPQAPFADTSFWRFIWALTNEKTARRWFHFWQAISPPFPCALLLLWTISCGLPMRWNSADVCSTALHLHLQIYPTGFSWTMGTIKGTPWFFFAAFLLNFFAAFSLCYVIELQSVLHDTETKAKRNTWTRWFVESGNYVPICFIFRVQKLCMSISQNKRLDRKWVKTQKLQNS